MADNVVYGRYFLEPIGVDGELEAVAMQAFCSVAHRSEAEIPDGIGGFRDVDEELEHCGLCPGHVCDLCGKTVIPEEVGRG